MDRLELIGLVTKMLANGETATAVVDMVIAELTPDDGDECPVCGICP